MYGREFHSLGNQQKYKCQFEFVLEILWVNLPVEDDLVENDVSVLEIGNVHNVRPNKSTFVMTTV